MNLLSLSTIRKWSFVVSVITLITACNKQLPEVFSSDGVPISYEVHGSGIPTLVFVHGWSCDRRYWNAQVKPFSDKYQVVTIDLAGHGESGVARKAWTIEAFGEDVVAVIEKLKLQEVILIGHSMGGDAIVAASSRLPDRVKGMVWVDVYKQLGTYRTSDQVVGFIAPFQNDFKGKTKTFVRGMFLPNADASLVERVAADMSSAPPAIALDAMESAITYDRKVTVSLLELKLPVIAINPSTPASDLKSMEPYGVKVISMPGVGHFLMMEKPKEFNRLLFEAVDELVKKDSR